jgi:hypothetical protein
MDRDLSCVYNANETILISTSVPIKLDVPISIEINETRLATYVERLRAVLDSILEASSDFGR